MRFAVLADAHIGRTIPPRHTEQRREAFFRDFSNVVDAIFGMLLHCIFDAKFRKEP